VSGFWHGTGSTSPHDPQRGLEDLAAVTPAQLAGEIRTAAADVYLCAQAWRSSAKWRGDKLDRKGYEVIAIAVADLNVAPEPATHREVNYLVDAVAPILKGWWSPYPGPQQDLFDAVERLRRIAMHRAASVQQARSLLGLD
jgi:hypothetical protein